MPFFGNFAVNIITALADQLTTAFEALEPGALNEANLLEVPPREGVYHLFRNGVLVYVGKADNLRGRLSQHRTKIMGRRNINIEDMTFTCLATQEGWTALAPESALIKHYKNQPGLCEWNGNGFGTHDPGRNRETTDKDPEGFDSHFPIRADWPCAAITAGAWNVRDLLIRMKDELPFLLRYEANGNYRAGHPDYNNVSVDVPQGGLPATELLQLVAQNLPGWQATRFPSHLILYKEQRDYAYGVVIFRHQG